MQKQFKYDDAYLYDLETPLRPKPKMEPENFAYDYEAPADLGMKIVNVLERSYYNFLIDMNSDEYWNFYTNCEPSVFKMIYERALMEKHYEEDNLFCLTQNEENLGLDDLIPRMTGRNGWSVVGDQEGKSWQPPVFIDSEEYPGQKQVKLNDPYLYDLNVPVRLGPEPEPEDYAYDYEVPFEELGVYIGNVLKRTYHSHIGYVDDDDDSIVHFYTDCEPDVFKMVYERALMEKFYEENGRYCISKNEDAGWLGTIIPLAAQIENAKTFDRQRLWESAQKLLQIYKLAGGK